MSNVTKPIVLDETMQSIKDLLEAHNHLVAHQNAAIDLLASDKRATLTTDIATVAALCKSGEILEVMDYGDYIDPEWVDGETHYNPPLNLCHEADAELEDGEAIHGAYFEWDKTTPVDVAFDAPEAIYVFDGTEGAGDAYILIGANYGTGWVSGKGIQITLTEAPSAGDQLTIALGASSDTDPTAGRTWTVYSRGGTTAKQTGTTREGTTGTLLGSTYERDAYHTNGKVGMPARVVYGSNRWSQSALRQWLNSAAPAGEWWTPQHDWDRPVAQAATLAGFLAGYEEAVRRYFKPIKVVTIAPDTDGGVEDVTYDRVFPASLEQTYIEPQAAGEEGEYWEYYKRLLGRTTPARRGETYARLIKYQLSANSALTCFRRSAHRASAYNVWCVTSAGRITNGSAYSANRCAPSVFISE